MAYYYPKTDPKWTQAIHVEAVTPDASYVNVKSSFGKGYEFKNCKRENHNRWGDPTRSDVIVETVEYGWLCIWFHNADIIPLAPMP